MQIAALGNIVFEVSSNTIKTFNNFSRSRKARIAKHDIIGHKPKLEFQGIDLADISFNIYLNEGLGINIERELRNLDDIFINGMAASLVIGSKYYGDFLITGIDENVKYTYRNGNSQVCEVPITLQEYISDRNNA